MMRCPICSNKTRVTATSRSWNKTHNSYKRYRWCDHCEMFFTTIEEYAKDYTVPRAYIRRDDAEQQPIRTQDDD